MLCEEASGQNDVFRQWLHDQSAAQRFEHGGNAGGIKAEPAQFLREGGGNQAQLSEQRPVGGGKAVRLVQESPAAVMIVMVGNEALGQSLEHFFVFVEIEIHVPLPSVGLVYHHLARSSAAQKTRAKCRIRAGAAIVPGGLAG